MRFTLALAALAAVLPFGVLGAPLLPRISLTQPFPITSVARNIAVTPQTFPRAPEPEPAALTGSELSTRQSNLLNNLPLVGPLLSSLLGGQISGGSRTRPASGSTGAAPDAGGGLLDIL